MNILFIECKAPKKVPKSIDIRDPLEQSINLTGLIGSITNKPVKRTFKWSSEFKEQIEIDEGTYWKDTGFKSNSEKNIRKIQYGPDQQRRYFSRVKEFNIANIDSPLKQIKNVPGISKSYSYFGKAGSTFAWHVEDQAFYSIFYLHAGSPKI